MGMRASFIAVDSEQIDRFMADPDALGDFVYGENQAPPQHAMDVDKAWHAIHFVLNGSAEPGADDAAPVIFGGEPVGEEMDYGPVRVLRPAEVRALSATLAGIGAEDIRARFSSDRLAAADIYPGVWTEPEEDLDYVLHNYREMAHFYADAAQRGDGLLLYIA